MKGTGFPPSMRRLINELSKLPSIGEKTAQRLSYHLINELPEDAVSLAEAIKDAVSRINRCKTCFSLAEQELCEICQDQGRDNAVVCVVEKPADLIALERSGGFTGLYHVLHGLWSPLRGTGTESTTIDRLIERVARSQHEDDEAKRIQEVILATATTVEGDATALYISEAISAYSVSVSRIAQGLPKGGELEYADEITLGHALRGRRKLD